MAPTRHTQIIKCMFRHQDDDSSGDTGDSSGDLGAAGKAALDAERRARKDAERAAKAATDEAARTKSELEALRVQSMTADEKAFNERIAAREAEIRTEVEANAASRIAAAERQMLSARVLAKAAGRLANPADAAAFLDLDSLERDAQGAVTDDTVQAVVDGLLKERPYLAAKAGNTGSADQGSRRDAPADLRDRKQLESELAKFGVRPRA
jgi:hypothetical protein